MTRIQPLTTSIRGRDARATIVFLVLIIALSSAAASPSTPLINLGEELGSIEIVRCHFGEGRIVVRFDDELHVLHEGGRLETSGLKVVEINVDSATFVIRGPKPAGHLRIVRVTESPSGVINLRELSTDPATLTNGKGAAGAPMAAQQPHPPDPSSED